MKGIVTLVAGGGGNVGEGIVRAFLARGATVVVPSRSPDKLERLGGLIGDTADERLVALVGQVAEPSGAEALRDEIRARFGRIDAMVASVGGWVQSGPLVDVSVEDWRRIFENNLTSHFVMARTFLPLISEAGTGSYTLIGGGAGEAPAAGAGPVSVAAAGVLMLGRALALEHGDGPVRVNQLVLGPVMTRKRAGEDHPAWITADQVGGVCARLATSGEEVRGETVRLPDRDAFERVWADWET